jgi:hypothetical protein
MHTIKQIMDNQKSYRKQILQWLTKDLRASKKELLDIKCSDEYIQSQVDKLKGRFKKASYKKEIDKLFFIHPKRNEEFYAWWDASENEVVILSYGKK